MAITHKTVPLSFSQCQWWSWSHQCSGSYSAAP